jgi:hypothetical protein
MRALNMMKLFFPIFLLISGLCQAQTGKQDVLALHQKKFEWMSSKQLDSLSKLLDQDVLYIHSNGWIETKEDVLGNLESGKLSYRKVTVDKADARAYENTVIVQGSGLFEVALEGKPLDIKLNYTEVYVNVGGAWKLVSRHACKI